MAYYGGNGGGGREIRSPVYQIDFTAVDAGKRIASTKRRIRWRFGFTNQDALNAGETGTGCRGEEHDITLIWSLTSGKRLVLADGQEVHYSNSRSQIFDFSWTMRGNHVLKVVAHASSPVNVHPNFRQYDFFVDGMSFFNMPKVYRLGLTENTPVNESATLAIAHSTRGQGGGYSNYSVGPNAPRRAPSPRSNIAEIEAPTNRDEEEAYLKEAIKASLSDVEPQQQNRVTSSQSVYSNGNFSGAPASKDENLLIDFMSEPGPVPAPSNPPRIASSPHPTFESYAPQPIPPVPAPAAFSADPFGPPPVAPLAPTPAAPYGSYAPAPVPTPQTFASPPMPTSDPPAPDNFTPPVTENPMLSMAPQPAGLGSDANAAYEKFSKMDQFDLVSKAPVENRENPFDFAPPPAEPAPTLSSMKASHVEGEKKEVMKSSMVVASSAQQGNWGGYGAQPVMGQMMGQQPGMMSPNGTQPVMGQTMGQQPGMMSPNGTQPVMGQTMGQQPGMMSPGFGQQMNNGMNSSMPLNNGQMGGMANGGSMAGNGQQPQFNYNNAAPNGYGQQQQSYYGGQAQGF